MACQLLGGDAADGVEGFLNSGVAKRVGMNWAAGTSKDIPLLHNELEAASGQGAAPVAICPGREIQEEVVRGDARGGMIGTSGGDGFGARRGIRYVAAFTRDTKEGEALRRGDHIRPLEVHELTGAKSGSRQEEEQGSIPM